MNLNDDIRCGNGAEAHWIEVPVIWRTRRKYECSNCGSYVTGRFSFTPVKQIHKYCHECGAHITGATEELARDENGFLIQNT